MTQATREKQTTINVQEKANLIWAIADKLVGVYKPHEYGKVKVKREFEARTPYVSGIL